jgi:hypothetical protein
MSATHPAILINNGDKLWFGKIMVSDLITLKIGTLVGLFAA